MVETHRYRAETEANSSIDDWLQKYGLELSDGIDVIQMESGEDENSCTIYLRICRILLTDSGVEVPIVPPGMQLAEFVDTIFAPGLRSDGWLYEKAQIYSSDDDFVWVDQRCVKQET